MLESDCYPDNSFDAVTLWDVLFHVQDPYEEIRECFRVLKRRGVIGIRVRNVLFEKMIYRAYSIIKRLLLRICGLNIAERHCLVNDFK